MTDSDDDVYEETTPSDDAVDQAAPAPIAPAAPVAAAPPPPMNPLVAAHLQSIMAKPKASDDDSSPGLSDLQAAQQTAAQNQLFATLARAGGQLGHALSRSTTPMDESGYNALSQSANAPVSNLLAQQKFEQQEESSKAAKKSAQIEADKNDPTSNISKLAQKTIATLYPGKYSDDVLALVTAASAQDSIFKPLEMDAKMQELKQASQNRTDLLKLATQNRAAGQANKVSDAQDKAYTTMRKDLESFRGNQSVQQAAVAVQNGDKALALTNSSPTSQNLSLLADEMAKIATGGVPGEHGTQALAPNNLNTKLAEMKAFINSKPEPADVKGYMDNNRDYLNQVMDISKNALNAYRSNIAKGYKNRVKPDDYQEAMDDYSLGGKGIFGGSASGGVASASNPIQQQALAEIARRKSRNQVAVK